MNESLLKKSFPNEASARNLLKANHGHQQCQQQPAHNNADTLRRRNRKRCNGDLSPTSELKKFRQGGGVSYAHCGATSTKDHGLAAMFEESELLRVNADDTSLREAWIINGGCCWAAGNHNQLNNSDYKRLSPSCGLKSTEDDAEYEKILFETHGCSVYHLHRLRAFDNDCIETEF
ncbi:uncharacterized protein LOC143373111 isoform X3 [Andrena cerasifolii]|uniref:uncharacterized protein LOC143373111 isoform X3 n=1 Tax=Andrena cerasifolii TaxID=2819439 RepID=UPI0040376E10